MIFKFDRKSIKEQIEKIPSHYGWLIFAASTTQRFLHVISEYEKQTHLGYWIRIFEIDQKMWKMIFYQSFDKNIFQEHISWIESIIPDDNDDSWTELTPLFDDSICMMAYTIDISLSIDSNNPFWVAERAFNCCYNYVEIREAAKDYSVDFTLDSVVQQELSRQQRDLRELTEFDYEHCDEQTWYKFVERFLKRSKSEPALSTLSDFIF